ncbi:unnamed protein product [Citrullus colocynthis]|uniref:Uncharacterized protein n=1 Tax=Citrullus colocynthis TaxID=252529 RepID=A0ABP0XZV0_9ROSI
MELTNEFGFEQLINLASSNNSSTWSALISFCLLNVRHFCFPSLKSLSTFKFIPNVFLFIPNALDHGDLYSSFPSQRLQTLPWVNPPMAEVIELELVATQPRELGSENGGVSLPFLVKFLYCGLLLLSLRVTPSFSLSLSLILVVWKLPLLAPITSLPCSLYTTIASHREPQKTLNSTSTNNNFTPILLPSFMGDNQLPSYGVHFGQRALLDYSFRKLALP